MLVLIAIGLFFIVLIIVGKLMEEAAARRRETARLMKQVVVAAYEAGRHDRDPDVSAPSLAVAPTPYSRAAVRLPYGAHPDEYREASAQAGGLPFHEGYWTDPPVDLSPEEEVSLSLRALRGRELEICFTGFPEDVRLTMEETARAAGMRVRTNVAKHLTLLCVGSAPGPVKLKAAMNGRVPLICGARFKELTINGWTFA